MIFPMMMGTQKKLFPATAKALSFTRLSADQLGQRLLRSSGPYSGDQQVSSKKVLEIQEEEQGKEKRAVVGSGEGVPQQAE